MSAESWLQGIPSEKLPIANERQVFGCPEGLEENWECIVEIQVSLPAAGSKSGHVTRVCVIDLTHSASHLAQSCILWGFFLLVGFFLLIVFSVNCFFFC